MKKKLFVTLADKNYLNQAKQLFSSAYFNAGWEGEYMLLAHEVPESDLAWFKNKGILVKPCQAFFKGQEGRHPVTTLSKFYLFTEEFKNWSQVVYYDADSIVQASLDRLLDVKGFAAVSEHYPLFGHFVRPNQENQKLFNLLKKDFNLRTRAFISCMMAFNTGVITDQTFNKLKQLYELYHSIHQPEHVIGDQPTLNLFFYRQWKEIPYFFTSHPVGSMRYFHLSKKKIRSIAMHFSRQYPWDPNSDYYSLWSHYLMQSDGINQNKNLKPEKRWSRIQIEIYWLYLKGRQIFFLFVDPRHPLFFLKVLKPSFIKMQLELFWPKLYFKLKETKFKIVSLVNDLKGRLL